jgi:hypothetical protein
MSFDSFQGAKTRRVFMMQVAVGGSLLAAASQASAQALVAETDPQAKAMAYVADGTKVDKAKFPKYAPGQNCANCALYQAKAGAPAGGCPLFAGKQVSAKAWCNSWVKKG